ncbi:MAG: type III-B CRISPR module RAMP protein Cmr4 [Methanosarcina sp.]|uniref:type III-B CRISPR module RAMP protein Cmr4 n=1 Tax=Methanosarcina sp. TaxID=2213 RepID=UPI002603806C|nr:type III-B CRISPR module RAMP protein Cmr4 [Methanosarcina sp.]MDD3248464.1 type III-B CRISPR module RAMP protein Cmr4 [Methanosarcina sp.]
MNGSNGLYTQQRYLFMALDPIHIGTGQSQLGRVDNTIVREPGTNLPKIPGTSLMGAARQYASMKYGKLEAAGLHKKLKGKNHENCPIIYTFGTYTDTEGGQQGKISISDAQILLFPVNSIAGPLWVSTKETLEAAGFSLENDVEFSDESMFTSTNWGKETLNLGWLSLKAIPGLNVVPPDVIKGNNEWNSIANRLSIVSSKLFSQIVNSNLEVRTSVAINPETGTAEDKALFTYEAIPRATWLFFDVVQDDYKNEFPPTEKQYKDKTDNIGDSLGETWNSPIDVLNAGFHLIEYLGIGGMVTRGFGRMKNICGWEVENES